MILSWLSLLKDCQVLLITPMLRLMIRFRYFEMIKSSWFWKRPKPEGANIRIVYMKQFIWTLHEKLFDTWRKQRNSTSCRRFDIVSNYFHGIHARITVICQDWYLELRVLVGPHPSIEFAWILIALFLLYVFTILYIAASSQRAWKKSVQKSAVTM